MNDKDVDKIQAPWWRDGIIIFVKVSAYIAVPVILTSYVGKYFDQKNNSGNLYFFIFISIGFLSTIYLIWREMKIYKNKIEEKNN